MIKIDWDAGLGAVDPSKFPVREDFRLDLEDCELLGMHVRMLGGAEELAGFAWWDHADADIFNMTDETIPIGSVTNPHTDADQGWEILIWEHDGFVYVAQGSADYEHPHEYERHFCVPKERYLSEWKRLIERVRAAPQAFTSIEAALPYRATVRSLRLGNQRLESLPDEIGSFVNVEYIDLYLNNLTELPGSMGNLRKLRDLDLRFNKLTSLPSTFSGLESLKGINLAENRLTSIPAWVAGHKKLKTFFIPDNPIPREQINALKKARPDMELEVPRFDSPP